MGVSETTKPRTGAGLGQGRRVGRGTVINSRVLPQGSRGEFRAGRLWKRPGPVTIGDANQTMGVSPSHEGARQSTRRYESMGKRTFFTIQVNGKERVIFSASIRQSGDLTLIVRHNEVASGFMGVADKKVFDGPIVSQRYSIHESPNSEEHNNCIVFTHELANGKRLRRYHYTKALKLYNNFTLVHFGLSQDLTHDSYDLRELGSDRLSLGQYNPRSFKLNYAIFVSRKDQIASLPLGSAANVTYVDLGYFRLTIMWGFVSLPSFGRGYWLNISTLLGAGEKHADLKRKLSVGFVGKECFYVYSMCRDVLTYEYLNYLCTQDNVDSNLSKYFKCLVGHYAVGLLNDHFAMRAIECNAMSGNPLDT